MNYCGLNSEHVGLLKKAVEVPFKDLVLDPAPQLQIEEICELCDDGINIRRVFVKNTSHDSLADIGWVHNEEVKACLSCNLEFGFFRWKHHCRTCGNLVCIDCTSPGLIESHSELGQQIVCKCCFSKSSSAGVPASVEEAWGHEVYRSPSKEVHHDLDEVRAAPAMYQCEAYAGFVIQAHRAEDSADTVYINVLHHDSIRDFYRVLNHVDSKQVPMDERSPRFYDSEHTEPAPSTPISVGDSDYAFDLDSCVHSNYLTAAPETEKVTPLVYVYGPCSVQDEECENTHFLYNVLVSSSYFDLDLNKDSPVLITYGTSVNKIIQVVNSSFDEVLDTHTFSLLTLARGYVGGVPPSDANYTRSNCSVFCTPESALHYDPMDSFPLHTVSDKMSHRDGSFSSERSDSGKTFTSSPESGGSFRKNDEFSERITREFSDELKAQAIITPDTLLRCEIVYPQHATDSEEDSVALYIVIDHTHSALRGTMFRIWNVRTQKKKWVKLKREPKSSGKDFYVTRKFLGSAKEYNTMIRP